MTLFLIKSAAIGFHFISKTFRDPYYFRSQIFSSQQVEQLCTTDKKTKHILPSVFSILQKAKIVLASCDN